MDDTPFYLLTICTHGTMGYVVWCGEVIEYVSNNLNNVIVHHLRINEGQFQYLQAKGVNRVW